MNLINQELIRFNHLTSEINAVYHEAAVKLGISDSAMQILYTICINGEPCPISVIRRLTGISKQTINSALRKLEMGGIIYLEIYKGKNKSVRLTPNGKALAERTAMKIIEMENRIFEIWSNKKTNQYLSLSQEYLELFQNEVKKIGGNHDEDHNS